VANPIGTILSLAMMLRQLKLNNYAKLIEDSISNVLDMDLYTKDINPLKTIKSLSTSDFGDEVVNEFRRLV